MKPIKMITRILPTEHVTAMCKAMRAVPEIEVVRTKETVVATYGGKAEVYRALKATGGRWIIRHAEKLFD